MAKIEDNTADLRKLNHIEGLEAAKASLRLLCCLSLLKDAERMKSDRHIFQTYFTSS